MKKIMLATLGAVALAAVLLASPARAADDAKPAAAPASGDSATTKSVALKKSNPETVVLRVNGTELKQGELDELVGRELAPRMRERAAMGQTLQPDQITQIRKLMEPQVVEVWTNRQLLTDAIKPFNINVGPEKVDAAIEQIRQDAASQGVKLEEALTSQGMTMDALKAEIGSQLNLEAGIEKLVVDKTGPLDAKPEDLEELRTSHILIGFDGNMRDPNSKPPTEEEKAEKKKKAEELLAQLKGGADFAELAKANSSCPSAPQGGDLDFHPHGQMVPQYDEAAWKLKDGEISEVVETPFGYHIIKATGRRTNDSAEKKDQLRRAAVGERIPKVLQDLRKEAKIEDLRPEEDRLPPMGMPGMMPPHEDHPGHSEHEAH